jgi:cytochrome c oxidase assembly protein subunit 11
MSVHKKNKKVLAVTLGVALAMLALSFAAVPFYRLFCQVTGWGGTTQTVAKNEGKVFAREFTVQFNADVDPNMPWAFKPEIRKVKVKVGEDALISYMAVNKSKLPVAGTAIHNVTPALAGKYFNKTQCFCFGQQVLQPGQKAHLPVTFFIDPRIMDDHELRDLKTITLSYTFYRQDSPELEKAMKKLYDEPSEKDQRKEKHV